MFLQYNIYKDKLIKKVEEMGVVPVVVLNGGGVNIIKLSLSLLIRKYESENLT